MFANFFVDILIITVLLAARLKTLGSSFPAWVLYAAHSNNGALLLGNYNIVRNYAVLLF